MRYLDFVKSRLDPESSAPLFRQLYEALRDSILQGLLPAGERLSPSRTLADQLGVSRTTVVQAYHQLQVEGYTEGTVGSGTYVRAAPKTEPPTAGPPRLSQQGRSLAEAREYYERVHYHAPAFCPAMTEIPQFAHEYWGRVLGRTWRNAASHLMEYTGPAGYEPLRKALVEYLRERRGVECDAEQILIVSGSQQALDVCARVLLDPGDAVWMEDPGYLGARSAFLAAGARVLPVPVDSDGMDLARAPADPPRAVFVTPSHQFPLGVTMPLARRLELLRRARELNCFVIEDDYDSEFRYDSRPVASLKSLDKEERVLYIGSFSKLLFPSLRLGYLVAPSHYLSAFLGTKAVADRHSPLLEQAAVCSFIQEDLFQRHVKRMRELYAERRSVLVGEVARVLGERLDVSLSHSAGLHVAGLLPEGSDDRAVFYEAQKHEVEANPLSAYSLGPCRPGVLLGYAGIDVKEIRSGVKRLAKAIEAVLLVCLLSRAAWSVPVPVHVDVWPWDARISSATGPLEGEPGAYRLDAQSSDGLALPVTLVFSHPLCETQEVRLDAIQANTDPVRIAPVRLKPNNVTSWFQIMLRSYPGRLAAYALAGLAGLAGLLAGARRLAGARKRRQALQKFDTARDRHDSLLMRTVGGYRLVQILGSGGMATVYRGLPEASLDEKEARAVKILSRDVFYSAEFRKRFEREVRAYQKLSHPHIVKILDWSVPDDLNEMPYMMLELVNGKTMRELLPLPWEQARPWMRQLFEAVDYAHRQGVIHRDLKPENIMVETNGLKVMDFGLARETDAEKLTATGTIMGTPAYMAPEQLGGGPIDARLDQYALGVIAYEVLTGRLPYEAEDIMQMLAQILGGQVRPSRLEPSIDAALMKMLAHDPAQRFSTVAEAWIALV